MTLELRGRLMNKFSSKQELAAFLLLCVGSQGITNSEAAYKYDLLNFKDHVNKLKHQQNLHTERLNEHPQIRHRIANQEEVKRFIKFVDKCRRFRGEPLITMSQANEILKRFPQVTQDQGVH